MRTKKTYVVKNHHGGIECITGSIKWAVQACYVRMRDLQLEPHIAERQFYDRISAKGYARLYNKLIIDRKENFERPPELVYFEVELHHMNDLEIIRNERERQSKLPLHRLHENPFR